MHKRLDLLVDLGPIAVSVALVAVTLQGSGRKTKAKPSVPGKNNSKIDGTRTARW